MKKSILCFIAILTMIFSVDLRAEVTSTTVITKGESNSTYYRIPAVTVTKDGAVVAICDKRGSKSSDLGDNTAITLVSKVSYDNGTTWSSATEIAPSLSGGYGDAAVVYDPFKQNIVCLFAGEKGFNNSSSSSYGKIYMTHSEDGITWDAPTDITDQITGQVSGWSGGFVASGRMLYVPGDEGTGKLFAVLDANVNDAKNSSGSKAEYEIVIRSDDHGSTWKVVNADYLTSPVSGDGNESKLEQIDDNTLIMSIRSKGARRFATSEDLGATWSEPITSTIVEPSCNGDIMNVSYNAKNYLLQSVANDASSRKNVSIFYSPDNGTTWYHGRTLVEDEAAYSSLVKLENGRIGCYVEVGGSSGYDMVFYSMSMTDILPAQGIADDFDGTMVCNGLGYMTVPKDEDMLTIDKNNPRTITARILLNAFTNTTDEDFGVLSTRWHEANTSTLSAHQYDGQQGFEFIAGASESQSFGANVSVKGDASGNYRGCLNNSYHDGIKPSRWSHIALVFDAASGANSSVKLYIDGELAETQTKSQNNSSITMNDATIEMLTVMLVGNRYVPVTDTIITTTTKAPSLRAPGGSGGGFGGGQEGNNQGGGPGSSGGSTTTTTTTSYVHSMTPSTTRIFNSNIDDVRIYSEAMGVTDLLSDKASGFPIRTKEEGLLAAYDFANMELSSDGSAYVFSDISGNGHDGTTVCVGDYGFPEILHNINVFPIKPDEEQGTLTVTRFDGGDEITLANDETYLASMNQDFKATAEPANGYVLIGIFVNGVQVPSNGFFKAGNDAKVKAIFRKESDKEVFYLVSDKTFNADAPYDLRYEFTKVESVQYVGKYTLQFEGKLQGAFHVEKHLVPYVGDGVMAAEEDEEIILALYPKDNGTYSSIQRQSFLVMKDKVEYDVQNRYDTASKASVRAKVNSNDAVTSSAIFSVHPDALTDKAHYIQNPKFILTYNPDDEIETLEIRYNEDQVTSVHDLQVTADSTCEIYNLQGQRVKPENLTPGVYIVREDNTVRKVCLR